MLQKVNKADISEMMKVNKEYFRSCHGVEKVLLTYIFKYATSNVKMISMMLMSRTI